MNVFMYLFGIDVQYVAVQGGAPAVGAMPPGPGDYRNSRTRLTKCRQRERHGRHQGDSTA
jgi:hypothetical protein